jgi:hypothetical protein
VREIWQPKGGFVLGVANSTLKLLHCNPKARDSIFLATVPELNASVTHAFADPFADSVFVCVGDETWTHDPTDTAGLCDESTVAKALMVLRPGVILGCNGWRPGIFDMPLGDPAGPATRDEETEVWTRTFSSGTFAKYHDKTKVGRITWAGAPTPPPTPPPPPTPVCDPATFLAGVVYKDGAGIAEVAAPSAAECCALCYAAEATRGCKWFSFVEGNGVAGGTCWLKADDNAPAKRAGATSGATHA